MRGESVEKSHHPWIGRIAPARSPARHRAIRHDGGERSIGAAAVHERRQERELAPLVNCSRGGQRGGRLRGAVQHAQWVGVGGRPEAHGARHATRAGAGWAHAYLCAERAAQVASHARRPPRAEGARGRRRRPRARRERRPAFCAASASRRRTPRGAPAPRGSPAAAPSRAGAVSTSADLCPPRSSQAGTHYASAGQAAPELTHWSARHRPAWGLRRPAKSSLRAAREQVAATSRRVRLEAFEALVGH